VIARARELGAVEVEATPEAEAAWIAPIALAERGMLGSEDCTPGYYNNEGGPVGRRERLNSGGYPQGPVAFFDHIARWRATPELPGLELRDATGRTVQP
jgi:hypothetical protein